MQKKSSEVIFIRMQKSPDANEAQLLKQYMYFRNASRVRVIIKSIETLTLLKSPCILLLFPIFLQN